MHGPLVQRDGPETRAAPGGRSVPAEHRPFHPPVSACHGQLRDAREQRPPDPAMAMGLLDEEILEPEPLLAEPRRVSREEEREPDGLALVLRQEALEGWSRVCELRPD